MKICQPHWNALRGAIEKRGLGYLIAANSRDAHARAVADLQGRSESDDFDPLMGAHNMLWSRAVDVLGLYVMRPAGEDGKEPCPVCDLLAVTPPPPEGHRYTTNDEYFIDGPADAMLATAKELGLYPPERSATPETNNG